MNGMRQAVFVLVALLPSYRGLAGDARVKMKAPIQPEEGDLPAERPKAGERAAPATKPVPRATSGHGSRSRDSRASVTEVPGSLSFSTFSIGGRVSEPRVTFVLDPIPLEMVDQPFALDYHRRVMDASAKKDAGL